MNGLTFALLVVAAFVALVSLCPKAVDERSDEDGGERWNVVDDGG
jgi:hypothetical protein